MPQRSIYALLAGINEYPPPVTALKGCMHDVDMWEKYLKSQEIDYKVNLHVLRNAEATKSAVTSALQQSLASAQTGDIVFFFYSGHGTREAADPVFAEIEQDKSLESMVCHDSVKFKSGAIEYDLLSDKELHYLLSAYGKDDTHILTIFDCCHSGGITRNMLVSDRDGTALERRYVPTERMSFIAPMRTWEKFLFAGNVSRDQVAALGWMKAVPQRRHITLSACQNDESAFEQSGKGIFTSNMHDVLVRSGGSLSYYDLQSRVRLFTQNQFRQTPEIYAIRGHEDDMLRTFLDKPFVHKEFGCTCYFKKATGWVLDLGAIHGVSSYSGPVIIHDASMTHEFSIGEIFAHYAKLIIPEDIAAQLKQGQEYAASLKSHFSGTTGFFIEGDTTNELVSRLKEGVSLHINQKGSPFTITEARANAGYLVRSGAEVVQICNNDDAGRPVTEVSMMEPDAVQKTLQYMRHIAQWEYIRTLCNPEYVSSAYPVEFALYKILPDGSRKDLSLNGDTLEFDYEKNAAGTVTGKMKVQLTNTSKVKYYCAILYLSNEFQIYGNMLDGKVIGLSPGESAWIYNGDAIELDLEQHVVEFNYPYSVFYLKLLANPEPFQADSMEQSALPAPTISNKKGIGDPVTRGIQTRDEQAVGKVQWFTRTLCFKGRNPFYQEGKKL